MDLTSIKDRNWTIIESCGETGAGVDEGIEWMIKQVEKKETKP